MSPARARTDRVQDELLRRPMGEFLGRDVKELSPCKLSFPNMLGIILLLLLLVVNLCISRLYPSSCPGNDVLPGRRGNSAKLKVKYILKSRHR